MRSGDEVTWFSEDAGRWLYGTFRCLLVNEIHVAVVLTRDDQVVQLPLGALEHVWRAA